MMPSKVLGFVVGCIASSEAEGYESHLDAAGERPPEATPDKWEHDGKTKLWIVYGNERFRLTVKRDKGGAT